MVGRVVSISSSGGYPQKRILWQPSIMPGKRSKFQENSALTAIVGPSIQLFSQISPSRSRYFVSPPFPPLALEN
ncbi:hypothetical protein [Burkholderia sp. Bp9140]|uniref:hypothetical protein n=1 Tax=Burkholderia sp. Bp9140 TaxID=2184572 RepID=UPI000F5861DB|nr:hypothetical protein [Burkholderia sp. Bp9140]